MPITFEPTPTTYDEAFQRCVDGIDDSEREFVLENPPASVHFGLGMSIRNAWGLWKDGTPLREDFKQRFGLGHANDMTGVLFEAVWARKRGDPFDLDAAVQHYKDFWAKQGVDPLSQEKIP